MMNYKRRAKEPEVSKKAVLKEDRKANFLKANDTQKYAKTVGPAQVAHIQSELADIHELLLRLKRGKQHQERLEPTRKIVDDLATFIKTGKHTDEQGKTDPPIQQQIDSIAESENNASEQPHLPSSRSNSSELYVPQPLMPPTLNIVPLERKSDLPPLPSALIQLEAAVMTCDVELESLRLFQPTPFQKTRKLYGIWAVHTTNPLVALAVKYFDLARQYNPEAFRRIQQIILQSRNDLGWALRNGDIEMNVTTELFTSGDYLKKLFVEMMDRLHDESTLGLLENYDVTEGVFKVMLKALLIRQGQANERSNFDGLFRFDEIVNIYRGLEHVMGMTISVSEEIITITVNGRTFRIEVAPSRFQTYLEEELDVRQSPAQQVADRDHRESAAVKTEEPESPIGNFNIPMLTIHREAWLQKTELQPLHNPEFNAVKANPPVLLQPKLVSPQEVDSPKAGQQRNMHEAIDQLEQSQDPQVI